MKPMIGLLACVLLVGAEDKKKDDPVAGSWKVESLVVGGQERDQAKGGMYTFKGGKMTSKNPRGEQTSSYKVDASKTPATIDWTAETGQRKGMTTKAIYEVKGDTMKLCFVFGANAERPEKFDGSEQGHILITLKRDSGAKSEEKPK
jgi:uncharacterized protein (TIGR03067 family)